MSPKYATVLEEALELGPEERRALAETLLDSLGERSSETSTSPLEKLWDNESDAVYDDL